MTTVHNLLKRVKQKTINTAQRFKTKRAAAGQGLRAETFETWQPVMDEVLLSLPETLICPHDLFRILLQNPSSTRKRIILVTEHGEPVALVGLRERSGYWEPVTQWLVPGFIFPFNEGYLWKVLGALGLTLHVAWWRWPFPPQPFPWIKDIKEEPTYGISCSDDFEAFWRQTSHYKNIRKVRKRCKEFEFKINEPGIREWTIQNWGKKWGHGDMPDLTDRLLVAEYLEKKGLMYTLSLHDGVRTIAGAGILVHGNDAVAYVNHRDREYDRYGVMIRLIEACFFWTKEKRLNRIDIGGSADYKKKWAPEGGVKYQFNVHPI